ncbi:hypothetical protein DEO72_LG8g2356 [Vigna unguiculata]|uniref:Uncharacterized protein n=1 Tax=Vigna unguiculata TaxID=3917 RepID=A0A4D6MS30_VIGUN|nr:hypothetical protein DEO72_LG8g2356 [Vigna unguiculata]
MCLNPIFRVLGMNRLVAMFFPPSDSSWVTQFVAFMVLLISATLKFTIYVQFAGILSYLLRRAIYLDPSVLATTSTLTPATLANPSSTQGFLVFIRHPELNSRDVIPSSTRGMYVLKPYPELNSRDTFRAQLKEPSNLTFEAPNASKLSTQRPPPGGTVPTARRMLLQKTIVSVAIASQNKPRTPKHQKRANLARVAWRVTRHRQALHPNPEKLRNFSMCRLAAGNVPSGGSFSKYPKPDKIDVSPGGDSSLARRTKVLGAQKNSIQVEPRIEEACGYGYMGGGKSMETECDCVPQNWGE